ncbi:hypothetical protein ACFV7Q_28725 [Streptomyces sp. NPDC059851]|uniref:hypothetical protein n=1 Tax=Streptomyces sp. NPDC059851 TaxID=3346971 RepID=UPI003655505C
MRTVRAVAAVLLGAVALIGCGAGGGESPEPSSRADSAQPGTAGTAAASNAPSPAGPAPSGPGVPATPTPTAPSAASPGPSSAAGRLVTVTRSGGFAGLTTSVLVKGDGSWIRLDGKARQIGSGKLSPDGLGELRAALAAADFPRLPRIAMGGPTIYDGFQYAFVHDGYEVATKDGSVPPGLADVLSALPSFEPR